MTHTPAATEQPDRVGPQHEDWWSELEAHEIEQSDLAEIQRDTLDYDPFA